MKAAVVTRYGPPEVLEVRDAPAPVPQDGDVLVRVHASTVCYGDRIVRQGPLLVRLLNGLRRPRAAILGCDLAGTVVSVGRNVTRFAPGDQVFGSRAEKFGAYAELACVAEDGFLAMKPENLTLEEAACIFVGGACILYFLRLARIQPRERVLVHGASGSLGTYAVQMAKHYGAHVTAVCGPGNMALVRSVGADVVIDYTTQDFARDGQTYDVICDVLGKAGFPRGVRALAPRGRYLLIGFPESVPAIVAALLRGLWLHARGRAVFVAGPAKPVRDDLELLKALIEGGRVRPVIGRTFALRDIVEAHRYADTGHKVGNVVVVVGQA
jgi:NADPH:quinone reductase-like Zn-dependent oxidoreductase